MKKNHVLKSIPYILLLMLSFIQSFIFLTIETSLYLKVLSAFSTFILYFLIVQISQKLLKVVLIFSLLLSIFIYPTILFYGKPNYDYIVSLSYTDFNESFSYVKMVSVKTYIILFLLVCYTILLLKLKYVKINNPYFKYILLIYLFSFPVKKIIKYKNKFETSLGYYSHIPIINLPSYFVFTSFQVKKDYAQILKEAAKPSDWEIYNAEKPQLKDYFVVVIGESVRRDFLHAYGFKVENTPFIDQSPHIQFNNYISIGPQTVPSLSRSLALCDSLYNFKLNNNVVNLGKKIGYTTSWISNQGQIGSHDSPTAIIAKSSDKYFFLKQGNSKGNNLDSELLPYFYKELKNNNSQPKLIFIHMIGSHPYVCDRTDGKYDQFILSKDISCYVQSIKNTDLFLSKINNALIKTNKSYNLIYFSDHGQKINEDLSISHGLGNKERFEVPLLIWGNNITSTQTFNKIRNSKDFLLLFSELNNVKVLNLKEKFKFLSDENSDKKTDIVVDNSGKQLDYNTLENNPIPYFKIKNK